MGNGRYQGGQYRRLKRHSTLVHMLAYLLHCVCESNYLSIITQNPYNLQTVNTLFYYSLPIVLCDHSARSPVKNQSLNKHNVLIITVLCFHNVLHSDHSNMMAYDVNIPRQVHFSFSS